MTSSADPVLGVLRAQLDIAWALTTYHLDGLTTEECLWRPASVGLHVHADADGWRADWPDHEGYDLGPSSIAWTTWHIGFWWSMLLDHTHGDGTLTRDAVRWPGTADATRVWIAELHARWCTTLDACTDADLASSAMTRWPLQDRPFAEIVAWVNVELMKNAAEIGYARFLHGVAARGALGE